MWWGKAFKGAPKEPKARSAGEHILAGDSSGGGDVFCDDDNEYEMNQLGLRGVTPAPSLPANPMQERAEVKRRGVGWGFGHLLCP
jgi:hypothetical protein